MVQERGIWSSAHVVRTLHGVTDASSGPLSCFHRHNWGWGGVAVQHFRGKEVPQMGVPGEGRRRRESRTDKTTTAGDYCVFIPWVDSLVVECRSFLFET